MSTENAFPIASEADVQGWRSLDMAVENDDRAAGKIAEADDRKATRAGREAQVRIDLGVAAPDPVREAQEKALNDIGRTSQPVAYRTDVSSLAAKGLGNAGSTEITSALTGMAKANQLDKYMGDGFIASCIEALGTVKGLDDGARASHYLRNELMIAQRAGGEAQGKARIATAKEFLMAGGHMSDVIATHLAKDPLICELAVQLFNVAKKG